jgi:hypothetical protein
MSSHCISVRLVITYTAIYAFLTQMASSLHALRTRISMQSAVVSDIKGLKLFEKRVLKKMFAPKRCEIIRGWRKFRKEGHQNLYSSLSIIRWIKSRKMGWPWHVARTKTKGNAYGESQKERAH